MVPSAFRPDRAGRPLRRVPLLVLASLAFPLWSPAVAAGATPPPPEDPAGWIERIRAAAQTRSYAGTLVVSAGDAVSSSRVLRLGTGDQVYERVEALDGRQQRSVRVQGQVHTVWPERKLVTVERRNAFDEGVGLPALEPRLQAHYDLRLQATERVAGREAAVLLLKPRDGLRFAQRMWADLATGLLLRADVLSSQGRILESSAFSDLEIEPRVPRDAAKGAFKKPEGYRIVPIDSEDTTLESQGWTIDRVPAGFHLLGCAQRPLVGAQQDAAAPAARLLQAVFSDGLARVSIFVEADDPARPRQALMTQLGATHTLIKPRDGRWWITVMGDVPMNTLKAFADGLSRRP